MGQSLGVGVDKPLLGVKAMSPVGIEGTVHLIQIELACPYSQYMNMPDITGTVLLRIQTNHLYRSGIFRFIEEKQYQA